MKDVLVLSLPTFAPKRLTQFYHNQVATLVEIRDADEKEENESENVSPPTFAFFLPPLTPIVRFQSSSKNVLKKTQKIPTVQWTSSL